MDEGMGATKIPAGTVTFLLTDIEGSTARWERDPVAMRAALARHDALLHDGIAAHGGVVLTERGEGDSFFALFARASDAVAAACAVQRALMAEPWPEAVAPLRVRMALHTGESGVQEGQDYRGAAVNRCARLRAVAHGGQVLLSGVTHALVREALPPGVSLRDLGEYRLKDLTRSEHIFQLLHPDLPADFPALKTLDTHRHTLPMQLTPFIGREREVAAVRDRLLASQTRLLTLTGPGGTGKTRLALQVAAEVVEAFPDGVYFVNLAPISEPDLVLPTIAQALGVVEQAGHPLADTLHTRLRYAQMLLLLDNFEQVLDAAPLVSDLLAAGAGVRALVTSRTVLRVQGEREYPVPPLALPDPHDLSAPEALAQSEAVRLFVARARDVKHDFALTAETAPVVAAICWRLDGLPLAIDLAAARLRVLSPQALLGRLEKRLAVVAGGARDLPARQQTLRATIEWSYNLLTPAEQSLFARLAVFVGGCTLAAAEAVCAVDDVDVDVDVLGGVEALVAHSLLRQAEGIDGEPRYLMLETIREYALERLEESGEAEALRRQHAASFLEVAQRAAPANGGTPDAVWLERLEREHDNLRAALGWAHDRGEAELEARLAVALGDFWGAHGYQREAWERLERLLAFQSEHRDAIPADLRAGALWLLGAMVYFQVDYERAATLWEDSLALYRALGDARGMTQCLHGLGLIAFEHGDYERASVRYHEFLALAQISGDKRDTAMALVCVADVACVQGDAVEAERLYAASLPLCREIGDKQTEGYALGNGGLAAWLQQDAPRAAALFADSLALFRKSEILVGVVDMLSVMGRFACSQGDREQARSAFAESLTLMHMFGSLLTIADDLEGLAGLAIMQQPERAARLFGAADALRTSKRVPRWPIHQAQYERDVATIREALGEESFAAAWAKGQALPLERAIAYALEDPVLE